MFNINSIISNCNKDINEINYSKCTYIHKYIALDTFENMFEKRPYKYPGRDKLGLFASPASGSYNRGKSVGK